MSAADVSVDEAAELWRAARAAAGCPERVETVRLPLDAAVGRVTAEPVVATRSSPSYDAAAMDGIAVAAAQTGALVLPAGAYDVVDTGDPLPPGRDAVVVREAVQTGADGGVRLDVAVPAWRHVRSVGEDVSAGEVLLPSGHRLRPVDVAGAAAAGALDLAVHRPPVVAVLPTGDEVRPLGAVAGPGEVLDTNSLVLAGRARELGCDAVVLPVEPDDPQRLGAALQRAAASADLVVVVAGSSAGRDDHTGSVVRRLGTVAVHGLRLRPGHPALLGVVGRTPVLGAPGYPVAAALVFDLLAAPLLCGLQGTAVPQRPRAPARLVRPAPSPPGVDEWVRVRLARVRDELVADVLTRSAGAMTSLVRADGLVLLPEGSAGALAGEQVAVHLLRPLADVDRTVVLVGASDPLLDLLAVALPSVGRTLAAATVGSGAGLAALADGLCHAAVVHGSVEQGLVEQGPVEQAPLEQGPVEQGRVEQVEQRAERVRVDLGTRELGLLVPPGNPLGLRDTADLGRPGLRYVDRQPGSGTRRLLVRELARRGLDPSVLAGRRERSALAVAAAVRAGSADCGLGPRAAAERTGLGFVPVAVEPYALELDADVAAGGLLAPLLAVLRDPALRRALDAVPGCAAGEAFGRVG